MEKITSCSIHYDWPCSPNRVQSIHAGGFVRQRGDPETMSKTFLRIMHIIISYRCVRGDSIVPERNRSLLPFHADLEVLPEGDVLDKKLQQCLGLFVFKSNDPLRETRVHEKCLLASSL